MSTLGNTTTPGHTWHLQGANTPPNSVYSSFTTPSGGGILVTAIHAYFDLGANGPATAWVSIWNSSGTKLASVAISSVPTGSQSVGGQAWHTGTLGTAVYVAGGVTLNIGFETSKANGFVTTDESSGSSEWWTDNSPPENISSASSTGFNAIGAYVDYTPAGGYVWNGSSWVACDIQIWNGSAWVDPTGDQVWNGSSWVNGS